MKEKRHSIVLAAMLLIIAGCTISPPSQGPEIYTNVPTQTLILSPTHIFPPSPTPTLIPVIPTHYPMPTGLPTSDSKRIENIASISREEAEQYSREELLKVLVSRWLEGYKHTSVSRSKIDDYYMGEVTIISHSTEPDADIIAWVDFSIQPTVQLYSNWAAWPTKDSNPDDPWWHLFQTFGVVRQGDTFWLSVLPGWGT